MSSREARPSARERTRADLYRRIRAGANVTRGDLVEATGLARSTVNSAVARLLSDGLITETEVETKGPGSGSGRPAVQLRPKASGEPVGGIDFGHSHLRVAIADALGRPMGEAFEELDVDLEAAVAIDLAVDLLARLSSRLDVERLAQVVAGVPGPVDSHSGLVRSPTILSSWVDLNPVVELRRRLDVPVRVENDAVLGAIGELHHGAGRYFEHFLYVKASHGIGASIIIDRRPYHGSTGLAGEIGHTPLPGRTDLCRCGNRGCLEAVVSVESLRSQIAHTHPNVTPESISLTAPADSTTVRILDEAGRTLGGVLADLCNLLNPEAIIVGGEIGAAGDPVIDGIRAAIDRRAQPATAATLEILPAALGVEAELTGALQLAAEVEVE